MRAFFRHCEEHSNEEISFMRAMKVVRTAVAFAS